MVLMLCFVWRDKISAFTKGLGIFWRTELRLVVTPLAIIISMVVMGLALILAIAGLTRGFWLFHAPVRTPWSSVWLFRGSAALWMIFIGCVLVRHIMRLGNAGQEGML